MILPGRKILKCIEVVIAAEIGHLRAYVYRGKQGDDSIGITILRIR